MYKILLINPPSPYLDNDVAYPPSGLLYLSAVLEKEHDVSIIDLAGNPAWRDVVPTLSADLFGITCVTPNFRTVQEIAFLLPQNIPIIIGGIHPTFLPQDVLDHIRCDAVVQGEAEVSILELIDDLKKDKLKKIYNGGTVPIESIIKPARHLVDLHKYLPGGEHTTPIYTSRGCPYNCNFCSKITGQQYRVFPISQVMEEIEYVMGLGYRHILFGDDDIGIQPKRLKEILEKIQPLKLHFRLNQDARIIDEEILALAAEAGCTEISFGIESGSQRILDLMNKRTTVEASKKAIILTRKHGMKAKAYFVVNFPGEDDSSIHETLEFAQQTKPDKWLLSSFAPLPGSDTFQHPGKYDITWLSPKWEDYYLVGKDGDFKPCFETSELSIKRQIHLHDTLHMGLKEILG
jgi:radical SAM superfamily enzyme YgiQ (UPF0313 family)